MKPYQERVIKEKEELVDKVIALEKFMEGNTYRDLPLAERDRLSKQREIMLEYFGILDERIAAF